MTLVDLHHVELGVKPACDTLGISRATWYRRRARTEGGHGDARLRSHPRRIGPDERARILAVLCEDRFADLTPRQVHAALLSEGTYLCSPSSMYRILRENRAIRERRRIASHPRHEKPVLVATRPDQVWTWDITRLPALEGGHLCLYVAIDLYSRCVVAWRLARSESGALARDFIHQAILANGVDPAGLTVHADRGVPMTSEPLSELCARLGITRSHSRPRTSNDNAFSESQFKTLKYGPACTTTATTTNRSPTSRRRRSTPEGTSRCGRCASGRSTGRGRPIPSASSVDGPPHQGCPRSWSSP